MRRKVFISVGLLAVLVILVAGYFTWSYFSGPIMKSRESAAVIAVKKGAKTRQEAGKAVQAASDLPVKWKSLTFDEEKEILLIAADLAENRQYKADNYRDPAAAQVAKDIAAADKSLAGAENDLKAVHKELAAYHRSPLPGTLARNLASALRSNENASRQVKDKRAALSELKSDNYIWGHLAIVVKADGDIMAAVNRSETALRANDYTILQEANAAGKTALADSVDWLQVGELELTNVGVYSKDTADLKRFNSKSLDTIRAYEQAAMFMFGNRADVEALQHAADRASAQRAELKKMEDKLQIGRGYKTWFLAAANRRL